MNGWDGNQADQMQSNLLCIFLYYVFKYIFFSKEMWYYRIYDYHPGNMSVVFYSWIKQFYWETNCINKKINGISIQKCFADKHAFLIWVLLHFIKISGIIKKSVCQ